MVTRHFVHLVLGIAGLSVCTWASIYAKASLLWQLALLTAWSFYLLVGLDLYSRRPRYARLGLSLGLVFLLLPPLVVMSYDSVVNTRSRLVTVTRAFPPEKNDTASNATFILYLNGSAFGAGPFRSGTFFLNGQLEYNMTFQLQGQVVKSIKSNITKIDLFYEKPSMATSILHKETFYPGFHGYWDWLRNVPCADSTEGPLCGFEYQ